MQRHAVAYGSLFEGRYELVSKLGEGGFGTVHKARQLTTGQLVALKIMRQPDGGDDASQQRRVARFLREARLCAQLRHPHVVPIVDSGQAADGSLYTVFAFVPGDNLADVLAAEGALSPRETRHLMLQVLDALACAHAQGVVHRDLKPSNVMVVATGARRNAVVLDFGVGAFVGDEATAASSRLTASTDMLGTPAYGAPEQSRGVEPSPRADIFSWGLVFIECLTGAPVFRGASSAEIFYRMLGPEPVPIPAALDRHPLGALLRGATAKDPAARAPSATGLLHALEACELPEASSGVLFDPTAWTSRVPGRAAVPSSATIAGESELSATRRRIGEWRHLTILCCRWRLVAPALGVEEHDGIARSLLAVCADVAARHRGRVIAALGDYVLVYFGYPLAEEDDARRAARAALVMAAVLREHAGALAARDIAVDAGLAIHTGPVLVAEPTGATDADVAVGATPRLATRLAMSAAPLSIVVSSESHRLLRDRFVLGARTRVPLDGDVAPLDLYELGAERVDASGGAGAIDSKSRLVGRTQEIELLVECWRRTRGGVGHACLVTGEPGIGKSRLARELRDRAGGDAHRFFEARCAPDAQHNALFPIIDVVARALGIDRLNDDDAKVGHLEAQLEGLGFVLAEVMPLYAVLFSLSLPKTYTALDVSPQRHKALTLQSIVSLLFAMAEAKPLLLVVEDLHWADATTIELVTQLVRDVSSTPMYALMSARPEFSPPFSTSEMLQIHLTRLDRPQTESMVAELAGDKPLPTSVVDHVVNRTDGVPLFVEEMTRMMLESGWLVERDDRYELSGDISTLEVPSSLRALLTARLDRLGRAKETAQVAAALGREFSVDLLSAASPLGPVAVAEDLDRLATAGLVLRKRRAKNPTASFKHALVRDAAYDTLSRTTREKTHARIASALEEQFPDLVRTRPDLLAHHHAAAEQKNRASRYAQQAAQQGLDKSAYSEAIAHASNVISWSTAFGADERVQVELAANGVLSQATMASRGWADALVKDTAERSGELLRQLDALSPHKVPVLWSLFAYYHTASRRPEARAVAEELVAVAESSGDPGQQAAAYVILALTLRPEGRIADAARAAERAIALYDPAVHHDHGARIGLDSLVLAKTVLAQLRWFTGETEEALELVASGLRWAREIGHVPSIAIGLLYGCHVYQYAGDKATTAAMTGEILALAEKYGLPAYEGYAAIMHAWAKGDEQRAEPILQRLAKMECKLGLTYYASLVAENMAERGAYDEAITRINRCLLLCEENGERYYEPELHRLRARFQARRECVEQ